MQGTFRPKDYAMPLTLFFASLALTLGISYYFKTAINVWISSNLREETTGITQIVTNQLNAYKLNYYGLSALAKEVYSRDPEIFKASNHISDAFGSVERLALISKGADNPSIVVLKDKNPSSSFADQYAEISKSDDFKSFVNLAMSTDAPVFFTSTNVYDANFISSIIPVDKASETYFYVDIAYEDIFLPVLKGGLLSTVTPVILIVKDGETVVYMSENSKTTKSTPIKRKRITTIVETVQLSGESLSFTYEETAVPGIYNILRKVPFTIVLVGTLMSLLGFCLILGVIYGYKSKLEDLES